MSTIKEISELLALKVGRVMFDFIDNCETSLFISFSNFMISSTALNQGPLSEESSSLLDS
jgi:hypothetical protein